MNFHRCKTKKPKEDDATKNAEDNEGGKEVEIELNRNFDFPPTGVSLGCLLKLLWSSI